MFGMKKKIKISALLDILASSQTYADIARNKNDHRWMINVKKLDDDQKRELILFNMFVYIQSIASITNKVEIYRALRDHFNNYIYKNTHSIFSDTIKQGDYENLIEQRYYDYLQCADYTGIDFTKKIGLALWNFVSGKESDGLEPMRLGLYAVTRLAIVRDFAQSIHKKYRIILD